MELGKTNRFVETEPHCPVCDLLLNGCTGVDHDNQPEPGDGTICARCYTFLVFTPGMTLVEMTEEDVANLDDDCRNQLIHIRKVCREVDRKAGVKPWGARD